MRLRHRRLYLFETTRALKGGRGRRNLALKVSSHCTERTSEPTNERTSEPTSCISILLYDPFGASPGEPAQNNFWRFVASIGASWLRIPPRLGPS